MNIFKKGILKFILAFLTIIFIDFVLLVATTNFIRSQQSPIDIIQGVSSNITHQMEHIKLIKLQKN